MELAPYVSGPYHALFLGIAIQRWGRHHRRGRREAAAPAGDLNGRELRRKNRARSPAEYELRVALAGEPTRVLVHEELLRGVWGCETPAWTRALDSRAFRLGRKLFGVGSKRLAITVWSVGYRMIDLAAG
ncbi:MAG: winged helix-turn-helix transcriptional regulator [Solirubrobacterales bacterium]|nr:winged helix-turn-helix transcriptional regulator [Solirubrobacterales bacterium]